MIVLLALAAASASAPSTTLPVALGAIHDFGACVARQSPRAARNLLSTDFQTRGYRDKLHSLATGNSRCVRPNWQLKSSNLLFAGAIAESLLATEVKPADLPARLGYDPARSALPSHSETETMALCTVMKAPKATVALLATEPATLDEHQAIVEISATLPQCVTKAMTVSLNPPALRSMLALAAWRIVEAPRGPAQ